MTELEREDAALRELLQSGQVTPCGRNGSRNSRCGLNGLSRSPTPSACCRARAGHVGHVRKQVVLHLVRVGDLAGTKPTASRRVSRTRASGRRRERRGRPAARTLMACPPSVVLGCLLVPALCARRTDAGRRTCPLRVPGATLGGFPGQPATPKTPADPSRPSSVAWRRSQGLFSVIPDRPRRALLRAAPGATIFSLCPAAGVTLPPFFQELPRAEAGV